MRRNLAKAWKRSAYGDGRAGELAIVTLGEGAWGKISMTLQIIRYLKHELQFSVCVKHGLATAHRQDRSVMFDKIVDAVYASQKRKQPELNLLARKIENRRRSLERSDKIIDILDFGAGSAQNPRPASTNEVGVRKKLSVSKITQASKSPQWARFLYEICLRLQPNSVIEMGTCVGISASYLGAALDQCGNGKLVTLEGDPSIAALACETFEICGLSRVECRVGPFETTLKEVADELRPLDFVFIDGNHRESATIAYFDQILPFMRDDGVLVFDDISWSPGMYRAWQSICRHERIRAIFDFKKIGIVTV